MSAGSASKRPVRLGAYAARVVALSTLVVALAIVLLLLAAARDSYQVRAVFDDVRGLIPGGDVTAGSIVVGSVTDVFLNEDGNPEVVMKVDDDFAIYRGATADIRLASNVGAVNRVIDLTQGDPSLDALADGALLSGASTDSPVDFDLAVSTLRPRVRGQIKDILVGLDKALRDRGPDLDRTLRHSAVTLNETANLLAAVNADGAALSRLVTEGRRVVGALASSPGDLGEAAERTAALLEVTARRQTELGESVELLGPALAEGRRLLERTATAVPNLRELVAASGPVVEELGPLADRVVPAGRAAAPFLHQTRALVRDAPSQLRAQLPLLRSAPPLIRRLGPLIERLNPIADALRVFTPETVGFFQNVGDAAANYDRGGHMIRVASGSGNTMPPSTALSGEIGPSECGPGLVVRPYHRTPGTNECQPWEEWRESLITEGGG